MKRKVITIIVIILALILLFPIPLRLKDGGSIEYKALLYTITKYHKIAPVGTNIEYIEGIGVKILGMEIYSDTNKGIIVCEDKEKNRVNTTNSSL